MSYGEIRHACASGRCRVEAVQDINITCPVVTGPYLDTVNGIILYAYKIITCVQIHMQCVRSRALLNGAFAGFDNLIILLQQLCLKQHNIIYIYALMKV